MTFLGDSIIPHVLAWAVSRLSLGEDRYIAMAQLASCGISPEWAERQPARAIRGMVNWTADKLTGKGRVISYPGAV